MEERKRVIRHLSTYEREYLEKGIDEGKSVKQIAKELGRSGSTLNNEIARCGGRANYRAQKGIDRANLLRSSRVRSDTMIALGNRIEILEMQVQILTEIIKGNDGSNN